MRVSENTWGRGESTLQSHLLSLISWVYWHFNSNSKVSLGKKEHQFRSQARAPYCFHGVPWIQEAHRRRHLREGYGDNEFKETKERIVLETDCARRVFIADPEGR